VAAHFYYCLYIKYTNEMIIYYGATTATLFTHFRVDLERLCGWGTLLLTTASGTPPNRKLRGRGWQLPLNDDSGRP
jgi:hypothetical protein